MTNANKNNLKNNVFSGALKAGDDESAYIEVVNNIKSNNVMLFFTVFGKGICR